MFLVHTGRLLIVGLALVVAAAGLSGCQSAPEYSDFDPVTMPDRVVNFDPNSLTIEPADSVTVQVFGVNDLSGNYLVDQRGNVKFPLLGLVPAAGLTPLEFSSQLETLLGQSYLQDPSVAVFIDKIRNMQITVDGSVKNPGLYPLTGQLSLLQAVALSGGPDVGANPQRVVVFRQIDGKRAAASFSLVDIRRGEAPDPPVYGNDVIVVDGSAARARYGDLLRAVPLLAAFRFF